MKLLKKRVYRNIIITILAAAFIAAGLTLSNVLIEPDAHIAPIYPKADISTVLSKQQLNQDDYQTLYYQTGLGKPAVDDLRAAYPDSTRRILNFQQKFFSDIKYVSERNSPISWEESVVDENGKYIAGTDMAPLRNGYILLTKSSHTYGWRNGHAALVVDAEHGITLESVVLGTNSCLQDISKWTNYPNFMLLRLKDASPELLNEVAETAKKNLNDIPYDLFTGIFNSKFKELGEIDGTQCAHLVWEAFKLYGYDLDSDGGGLVTPNDIANSPLLEVVQVYGVDPREIWP